MIKITIERITPNPNFDKELEKMMAYHENGVSVVDINVHYPKRNTKETMLTTELSDNQWKKVRNTLIMEL